MPWRKIVFDAPTLKFRRQQLRHKSTLAEQMLWEKLRNRKLGYKFIRQYSVEGYVMDFYCPEKKLGVELEGGIHQVEEVKIYDEYRFKFFKAYGIKMLRISNNEVLANAKSVADKIAVSLS